MWLPERCCFFVRTPSHPMLCNVISYTWLADDVLCMSRPICRWLGQHGLHTTSGLHTQRRDTHTGGLTQHKQNPQFTKLTFFLIWEQMTEQDWMPEFTAWKRMPYDFPNPCMIAATTVANLPAMLEEGKSLPSFHLLSFLFVWLLLLSNLTLTKVALCVREALTFVVIWPPSRCNFSVGLADFYLWRSH